MQTKIYVAGHRGMVGSAIVRTLLKQGMTQGQLVNRSHAELDLCNQAAVQAFFAAERPTQVYLAAARVGGIHANNTYPAEFIYDNLMVQANVIDAAFKNGVLKWTPLSRQFFSQFKLVPFSSQLHGVAPVFVLVFGFPFFKFKWLFGKRSASGRRQTLVGKHGWELWGCGQAGRFASLSTCP